MELSWREKAKRKAALEALKHVKDGYVVGLGSGSTVAYAIMELGKILREEKIRVLGIPTSHQAKILAIKAGIPLTTLDEYPEPDLAVDGADQVDLNLNLVKGMGAALTREKIVDSSARKLVIVVDESKVVGRVGEKGPIPVEVLPFAMPVVARRIQSIGGKPLLRKGKAKVGPLITDNGNFILDVFFSEVGNLEELEVKIKLIPGVVETGLFIKMAQIVYVGCRDGSVKRMVRGEHT